MYEKRIDSRSMRKLIALVNLSSQANRSETVRPSTMSHIVTQHLRRTNNPHFLSSGFVTSKRRFWPGLSPAYWQWRRFCPACCKAALKCRLMTLNGLALGELGGFQVSAESTQIPAPPPAPLLRSAGVQPTTRPAPLTPGSSSASRAGSATYRKARR